MDNRYSPMNIRCPTDLVFSRVTDPRGKLFTPWELTLGQEVMIALASDPGNPIEGKIEAAIGQSLVIVANHDGYSRRQIISQADIYYLFAKRPVTAKELQRWHRRKYLIDKWGWVGRSGRLAPTS